MFFLALVVFGVRAYRELPLNLLPDISYPALTVEVEYPGTAPAEMESLVARPSEEALATVPGLLRLQSVSRVGLSTLTLEFGWDGDMDLAVLDVRERLDRVNLPDDAESPRVLRYNPAQEPIMRLAVTGGVEADRLRWVAEELVEKRIEGQPGVAAVKVLGGLEPEVEVLVDEAAAAAYGIGLDEIARRLDAENVNLAGGRLDEGGVYYLVRTLNEFGTLDELRHLLLRESGEGAVRLRDVATVVLGHKDRQVMTYVGGDEAVFVEVRKTADANTVAVARLVRQRLALAQSDTATPETFPAGVRLVVVDDASAFIVAAIRAVREAAVLGGVAALLVLWLFLRDVRSTAIIGFAIPLSIAGTFLLMYLAGVSLNLMSLGGLALGVGMLVDNAIVVLENIARVRDEGADASTAAAQGTREVAGAVTASTLTTCAVFLPVVFVEGIAAQIFSDLALTVAAALLTSLVVALLFIPMVASRTMGGAATVDGPPRTGKGRDPARDASTRGTSVVARIAAVPGILAGAFTIVLVRVGRLVYGNLASLWRAVSAATREPLNWWGRRLDDMHTLYGGLLRGALRRPGVTLALTAGICVHAVLVYARLGGELIPTLHQGVFTINVETALGTPVQRTAELVRPLAEAVSTVRGVTRVSTEVGTAVERGDEVEQPQTHLARLSVTIAPARNLERAELMVQDAIRELFGTYPALACELRSPALFSTATPVEVVLTGSALEPLMGWAEAVVHQLEDIPGLVDLRSSLRPGSPEIRVALHRDRLLTLGLEPRVVADHLRRKIHGVVATRFAGAGDRIDIRVRGKGAAAQTLDEVRNLIVNPGQEIAVALHAIADITIAPGPSEIRRIDQQRAAVVRANVVDRDLESVTTAIRDAIDQTERPLSYAFRLGGQGREMREAFDSLRVALMLAVFLVYIVLASQFESIRYPLLILMAIPLAGIGVFEALTLLRVPISIVVFLGVIVLAGIVVNDAIVLVDAINQLRRDGMPLEEALSTAAHRRLRPIMMTTLTTVLGLVPMTLARGAGGEIQRPLAITIMSGLLVATVLTLVVIPVLYWLATPRAQRGRPAAERDTVQAA